MQYNRLSVQYETKFSQDMKFVAEVTTEHEVIKKESAKTKHTY